MILELHKKATQFINHSYARITDHKESIKSNGNQCPLWAVPEAYQYVTAFKENGEHISTKIPCINTPLSWTKISLYKASELYLENLKVLDQL